MEDDDGNQAPPEDEEKVSLAKIEEVVRKVLAEMAPGADPPELDPEDDEDKAVYSVRQAEDIAERAVASAMKKLNAKAPAKPKAAPAKSEDDDDAEPKAKSKPKEGAPTPPEESISSGRARLRKLLVGE
jgi:hypothetical protein